MLVSAMFTLEAYQFNKVFRGDVPIAFKHENADFVCYMLMDVKPV